MRRNTLVGTTVLYIVLIALTFLTVLLAGCGNQMFRQASYEPLDTPRAQPPADSVPVEISKAPSDAKPVSSPAYGDLGIADVGPDPDSFLAREPDLPPADLSDNARNSAAPAAVNSIRSPYVLTDPRFVIAGNTLFLNRCVQCHNAGGYGYGVVGSYLVPHPPDLAAHTVQARSDGALFWIVTMGQGKMPGLRRWTTPTERWALVAYVRSLSGADPAREKLISDHFSDTSGAPYPVYGEPGFEHGKNTAPFKLLGGAPSPAASRVYGDRTQPHELVNAVPQ
jgi:mono/diheme cytochrome c family protein